MIAVVDSGMGMDERTKTQIFEPFFTTKPRGRGTGLGLATVYGIVKQSGGYIGVTSEPNRGTTFRIYLPHVTGALSDRPPVGMTNPETGSEVVLLVEDDEEVRLLSRNLLERAGYRVFDARDAQHAEIVFQDHASEIDLLITDVIMPGANGPSLFKSLVARRPDLRVLYVSGYTDDAVVHQAGVSADMAFLQKPFTAQGLMSRVRETLDR
jgi:two-component system cell cycle sensor histidine kinase/response regulator CckA